LDIKSLGTRFRLIREKREYTQDKLAELLRQDEWRKCISRKDMETAREMQPELERAAEWCMIPELLLRYKVFSISFYFAENDMEKYNKLLDSVPNDYHQAHATPEIKHWFKRCLAHKEYLAENYVVAYDLYVEAKNIYWCEDVDDEVYHLNIGLCLITTATQFA